MKKHLTHVATYRFFVVTQLRAKLKGVCHDIKIPCRDTMKGRLKEECCDITKIVATQEDHRSLRVCCEKGLHVAKNHTKISSTRQVKNVATSKNIVATIIKWCQLKFVMTYKCSIMTQMREQSMNVCRDNKYLCHDNHSREISLKKVVTKSRQRIKK